jgi:hypothetical protein
MRKVREWTAFPSISGSYIRQPTGLPGRSRGRRYVQPSCLHNAGDGSAPHGASDQGMTQLQRALRLQLASIWSNFTDLQVHQTRPIFLRYLGLSAIACPYANIQQLEGEAAKAGVWPRFRPRRHLIRLSVRPTSSDALARPGAARP